MNQDGKIHLDRRYITGDITEQMPGGVLYEIGTTLGLIVDQAKLDSLVYRAKVDRTIREGTKVNVVSQPYDEFQLSKIALFVNPSKDCVWSKRKIIEAFNWMLEGHNTIPDAQALGTIRIGNPTPAHVRSVPAAFLYKWCLRLGGTTSPDMTIEQLREYCISLQSPKDDLIATISMRVGMVDARCLAKVVSILTSQPLDPSFIQSQVVNTETISQSRERLASCSSNPQSLMHPFSFSEAIVMGIMRFGVDLTKAINPIVEYRNLIRGQPFSDDSMRIIASIDPNSFLITHNFNPLIPCELYETACIQSYARRYNISLGGSKEELYQELSFQAMVDNFHVGVMPGVTSFKTTIELVDLTNASEVAGTVILCYGSLTSKMTPYTISELTDLFNSTKNFKDPQGGTFSHEAITNLKRHSNTNRVSVPQIRRRVSDHHALWQGLYDAISTAEIYQSSSTEQARIFSETYNSLSREEQEFVNNSLSALLEAGMCMRGWRGTGAYPVINAPNNDDDRTDILTGQALTKYHEYLSKLPSNGSMISDLPLMIYEGSGYRRSSNTDHGLTIRDRIRLVQEGDNTNNINSCIRMSSNWIVCSSYLYLSSINKRPDFDISQLRHIS